MIKKYKLVACLPTPLGKNILSNSYRRLTQRLDQTHVLLQTNTLHSALLQRLVGVCNERVPTEWGKRRKRGGKKKKKKDKTKLKYSGNCWALTKIFIRSKLSKGVKLNQFTGSVTTMEYTY